MALLYKRIVCNKAVVPATFAVLFKRFRPARGTYSTLTTLHGSGHAYEPGQVFVHRLFNYRGVVLFPYWAKVLDVDERKAARIASEQGSEALEVSIDSRGRSAVERYQLYYQILIDNTSQPLELRKLDSERLMLLHMGNQPIARTLYAYECVDFVPHEDILPEKANPSLPFFNRLFDMCFDYDPYNRDQLTVPYIPTMELRAITAQTLPWLTRSVLYCRTVYGAALSVMPLYLGWLEYEDDKLLQIWRFSVRVENKGEKGLKVHHMRWAIHNKDVWTPLERVSDFNSLSRDETTTQLDVHIVLPFKKGEFRGVCRLQRPEEEAGDCILPNFYFLCKDT